MPNTAGGFDEGPSRQEEGCPVAAIDFSHLSPEERLDLIGELWDSLSPAAAPVTAAQKSEIRRRLATLDQDIAEGRDAAEVLADLRRRPA
jgi:putative addiction module component (TIGR02574 family)